MEKEIQSSYLFKTMIKSKLLSFENEVTFAFKNSFSEASTNGSDVLNYDYSR